MAVIVTELPQEELEQNPQLQELTHGGFRNQPYHNWMEMNADSRYMGRELLKRTEPLDSADLEATDEIMAAASPKGTDGVRYSKWSK